MFFVSTDVFNCHILVDTTHLNWCLLLISKSHIHLGYDSVISQKNVNSSCTAETTEKLACLQAYILFQDMLLSGHEKPTDCHGFAA
jgi:hypothetical protein